MISIFANCVCVICGNGTFEVGSRTATVSEFMVRALSGSHFSFIKIKIKFKKKHPRYCIEAKKKRRSTPAIPTWSPTAVLSERAVT